MREPSATITGLHEIAEREEPRLDLVTSAGPGAALVVHALLARQRPAPVVLVVPHFRDVAKTLDDLAALCPKARLVSLPAPEAGPYEPVRTDRNVGLARASALTLLALSQVDILVTTSRGWVRKGAPKEALAKAARFLRLGDTVNTNQLALHLEQMGYTRVALVEDPGSFSARGDLFDVWPPVSPHPTRISLSFERIESLTGFDPETQIRKPGEALTSLLLSPAREAVITSETSARAEQVLKLLCDEAQMPSSRAQALIRDVASGRLFLGGAAYLPALFELASVSELLPKETVLVFDDPERTVAHVVEEEAHIAREHEKRQREVLFPPSLHYLDENTRNLSLRGHQVICLHRTGALSLSTEGFASLSGAVGTPLFLEAEPLTGLLAELTQARTSQTSPLPALLSNIEAWLEKGSRVVLSARSQNRAERLLSLLENRSLSAKLGSFSLAPDSPLCVTISSLSRGVMLTEQGIVLVTEEEIFGKSPPKRRTKTQTLKDALDDLRSLSVGDYVVHTDHGIARYLGLLHQNLGDHTVDLLHLEYAGGDKLLLPVYRLNQIQKFSADSVPRLDRLGGQGFLRAKKTVKKKVREMADQLLRLFAERKQAEKLPLSIPEQEYAAFEAEFPFEETPDQSAAIADVLEDLGRPQVMDRLVCGDVGFGKTEVALRAAFLAAYAGRQVALLCPTTVLAEQHRETFSRRFETTGLHVRSLSRFVSKKQQEEILLGLKTGRVDIVIGTHRLLSKDVHFKNLGLLIIDEEQRFGVGHKERLREIKKSVDALTLTATPIPRTLSLAVGGLRDMSLISTPPEGRRSIRTLSAHFDESLIQSAILRELSRGGQVFFVRNRIEGIYERASLLKNLVPEARVGVAHGQLTESELEAVMLSFVRGELDVLCATSIIESGLDIPRANTIIIDRADLFGLSQLYQIRGRVGRSRERAYCYLLLPPDARLSDEARSRIETLERYSELGSGFHVAKMDLELRGAGEFLGADQSGFISRVGYEVFLDLLEEATLELSGQTPKSVIDPEISIDIEALLPEFYVPEVGVRLSLYKRYAQAEQEAEVRALDDELEDRFGPRPPEAKRFSEVMRLKTELRSLRALGLSATGSSAVLHLSSDTPLETEALVRKVTESRGLYSLTPDGRLKRAPKSHEQNGLSHAVLLLSEVKTWVPRSALSGSLG